MATGSEISAVFCAAALMTPRPPFSQYSRADEVALFVSQYSVKSSSTSSFAGDCWGSLPYVHCAKPGCTRSHAARPAGESVRPYPTAGGRCGHLGRYRRRQVEVDTEQSCRCLAGHRAGDGGAPVAPLGDVAGVSEALHQLRPGSRDVVGVPTGAGRLAGEAVARHGRDDDVESVLGAASVRGWVRERPYDFDELEHRPRPTVRDDHRKRILVTRTDVDEVNVQPIDVRHELRQGIQLRFRLVPVVAAPPVPNQLLQLRQLRTLRLIGDGFLIGPSRSSNAPPKIIERGPRYVDGEGADRAIFGRLARGWRRRDNDGVGVRSCHGLSVARRGEHEQTDRKRGYRTGKKAAPSRRRGQSCPDRSTPRKDKVVGSRRVLQFFERHGRILVWKRGLSRVLFDLTC